MNINNSYLQTQSKKFQKQLSWHNRSRVHEMPCFFKADSTLGQASCNFVTEQTNARWECLFFWRKEILNYIKTNYKWKLVYMENER